MTKLKFVALAVAGTALVLSSQPAAAQSAKPISMGMKTDHVMEGGTEGAGVIEMRPGHTGAAMGFKVGDIIFEVGGKPISPEVLREYMKTKQVGDQLRFKVKRAGAVVELSGTAKAAPEAPPAPATQP